MTADQPVHDAPPSGIRSRRCAATCTDGSPCRAWAVRTSHPPRCAAHGGGRAPVGAPPGNQNACTHGFYSQAASPSWDASPAPCTIDAVIADLYRKQLRLSRYIDRHLDMDDLPPDHLARFYRIHAQSCSRLGRLLRDRHVLHRDADERFSQAMEQALSELEEELGIGPM